MGNIATKWRGMRVSEPGGAQQGRGGGCVGQGAGVERTYSGSWPGEGGPASSALTCRRGGSCSARSTLLPWHPLAAEVVPAACPGIGPTGEEMLRGAALVLRGMLL